MRVGHRHVRASDALHGRVQVVEAVLHGGSGDLGSDAEVRPALLDGHEAVGLLDGLGDGADVQGADAAEVDHLHGDALLLQLGGGLQGLAHHALERNNREVRALTLDLGLANGNNKLRVESLLADVEGLVVEDLVLEHDDGVRVADGRLHEAACVLAVPGRDHLEAGHRAVPRSKALRVLRTHAAGGTVRPAEHDRAAQLATGHVSELGGRVDDVVDGLEGKVPGHELDDGLESRHASAHANTRKAGLGDGRVDDALDAKLLQQALGHLVGALVLGHLLAHDEHLLVLAHLLRNCAVQSLAHCHSLSRVRSVEGA
mmetsp:Transcript_15429/g.60299  ORF Transcript_15429/g.60299 Transcript_15429/m.60299 type:complete len:315 (+) Transcript_15429:104-1048(+)